MHGSRDKENMHGEKGNNGPRGRNGQRGRMSVTMPSLFPSIPKGEIVGSPKYHIFTNLSLNFQVTFTSLLTMFFFPTPLH
jgi:hypothetical protein